MKTMATIITLTGLYGVYFQYPNPDTGGGGAYKAVCIDSDNYKQMTTNGVKAYN